MLDYFDWVSRYIADEVNEEMESHHQWCLAHGYGNAHPERDAINAVAYRHDFQFNVVEDMWSRCRPPE